MIEVVDQRDERRDRHPPLEVDRRKIDDQDEEDHQAAERLAGDLLPQDGPTTCDVDLVWVDAERPSTSAVGDRLSTSSSVSDAVCTRSERPLLERLTVTFDLAVDAGRGDRVRACWIVPVAVGTPKTAPPSNSMPRSRPRKSSATSETSRMTAEMAYQRRRWPTKS